jgi:hypothetical protein
MKSVRFTSLSHDVIETDPSVSLDDIDESYLWWSHADRMANKRALIQIVTCKGLKPVDANYSEYVLEAFRSIHSGGKLSSSQEFQFIFEVTKKNFNRGIEKYVLVDIHRSYRFRRKRLQSLIFALQDSQISMGLHTNQITELIRIASEKYSKGDKAMAYLFGQADEFAAKMDDEINIAQSSHAEATIVEKGSMLLNPAA